MTTTDRFRRSVLLTTEGTYPYQSGEVSTWCEALTRGTTDVGFTVLAVVPHPFAVHECRLPPAVQGVITVPLDAMAQAGGFGRSAAATAALRSGWQTTAAVVRSRFVPPYRAFLREALHAEPDSPALAESIVALYEYFAAFSCARTIAHEAVWEACVDLARAAWQRDMPDEPAPSLGELADAWRLLGGVLGVLATPIPRTDVTHSTAAAFCALPCVVAKIQRRTPYLLTEHGVYIRDQYLDLARSTGSFFVRWFLLRVIGAVADVAYAFADQVSPLCSADARWEHWRGVGPERIRVISGGADPRRCSPAPAGMPRRERPLVVNVAPIHPLRGQLDLIDAAAALRDTVRGVAVECHGEVADRGYFDECEARVRRLGLEGTVRFVGAPADSSDVYRLADVVASASLAEAFPRGAVEAMLCGAAVVATDVGGVSEVLGHAGRVVPPRDPQALAAAIGGLLASASARRQLGEAARARALECFTEDRFVGRYQALYQSFTGDAEPGVLSPSRELVSGWAERP